MNNLLRNAIILDTETLGLERGAGLHELAFMDLQRRHVEAFVLQPNAVTVQTIPQEHTRLAGAASDRYTSHRYGTWMEALHAQVERTAGKNVPPGMTMQMLEQQQPWLAAQLKHHPHLLAQNNAEAPGSLATRSKFLQSLGITSNLQGKPVAVQDVLGTLKQAMSGKTVWIANAAFESKQLGAQLGAMGPEAWEQFKSGLETWNPQSPDPFYVTGSEVTKARTLAQQSGDWTGVWKAYQQYGPKAGETAVRDIQDVTRALHSYGQKLGFTQKNLNYLGTGIDISHRLHAIAEGNAQRMGMSELHRAAEDAAVHEAYVLERNIKLTSVLQHVAEGTDLGKRYLQQGAEGPLQEAARYFQALEAHAPVLMEEQALKRLQRAQQDLLQQGYTTQRQGGMPFAQDQLTPSGEFARTWRTQSTRSTYTSMDQVLGHLEAEGRYGQYGVNLQSLWEQMSPRAQSVQDLNSYVHARVGRLKSMYSSVEVGSASARLDRALRGPTRSFVGEGAELLVKAAHGRGAVFAGGAAVLAFMGAATAAAGQEPEPAPSSIMHYGYDEWASRQQIEGMSEGTIARTQRHRMTDFGSPYQGPVGVQQVFIQQELLAEREKWLRAQYGARHASTALPGLPTWNPRGGYQFIQGGTAIRGEDYGMRGNLMKIDLQAGNWKISAEDADTVTLRRGGVVGALQSFFGLNKGYSFRLAGLDSTEVAHADRPAQPFANQAAQAFSAMLAQSNNISLLFDPTQVTYGRALGAVYADGRNLNYELVKRGLASHLPFGKARDAIIDYKALEAAEARAYQTNRGMWSQPWARSFYEHTAASGTRPTFNSLAKVESVVKNFGTMQMISAMEQAQQDGRFSMTEAALARELGGKYNVGEDKVGPWSMSAATTPSTSYLQEQLQDLAGFIRTKGRGGAQNKFSSRSGYGKLDASMTLDTMGTGTSVWNRRRQAAFSQYRSGAALDRARKARMAAAQRTTLQAMHSASPIAHHRM
jgi:endonuclease YncB( thermonuclease family)